MANVINLSILNNMPDGTYKTTVSNLTDGEIIHNDDVTFVGGVSQLPATTSALNDLITGIAVSNERPPLSFAPLLGSVVDDGVTPPEDKAYSLLASSYASATFSDVTVAVGETFSINVIGLTDSSIAQDLMNHSTGAAKVYYRGSDGRFRVYMDDGVIRSFTAFPQMNDGGQYYCEFRLFAEYIELWVNGVFQSIANGTVNSVTLNTIGDFDIGSVFGVTLSNSASYPMVSNDFTSNITDAIGANDLTYNGINDPLTESDFIEVSDDS